MNNVNQMTFTWSPTNAPKASSRYDDIWFLNPRCGWAVNSNGQILSTNDGGASWQEQFHDPTVYMRCIAFASTDQGWVGTLTADKILYETRNGGKLWLPVTNAPPTHRSPFAECGLSTNQSSMPLDRIILNSLFG